MKIYKSLRCDYCPERIAWVTPPKKSNAYIIYLARDLGWSVGKNTKCPECKKGIKRMSYRKGGIVI